MTTTTTKSAEAPEMPIADRLEHCAKFTGLDAVRELLVEAATAVRKRDAVVKLLEGELQDRALRPQAVPMTDTELCEALGIDWSDGWTFDVRDAVEKHHGIKPKEKA